MSRATRDLEWWRSRLKILKAIQPAMEELTKQANHLLTPMIEILDEDRETLMEAMQGETQWFDYQTVGHWIEEVEDLVGTWE
jgi:hypothetical protein